ncbi:MAG TPA: head-tail connector protein [Ktedonobacteraceae bacterium]|jgi:hypothetical protein|nr:head-tail connector protein [Ktedonobacteraceae bacterium]
MTTSYTVLALPSIEPLALSDAKKYLRVDYDDEDDVIAELIVDARKEAEKITNRSLALQTVRAIIRPDAIAEGSLSGPVDHPTDPWVLAERVTAIPYGFYGPSFKLPMSPAIAMSVVEYQLTPFDDDGGETSTIWTMLDPANDNGAANYRLDVETDPSTIYVRAPLAATRFRFTYTTGYSGMLPGNLNTLIKRLVGYWFNNREEAEVPQTLIDGIARYRIWEL